MTPSLRSFSKVYNPATWPNRCLLGSSSRQALNNKLTTSCSHRLTISNDSKAKGKLPPSSMQAPSPNSRSPLMTSSLTSNQATKAISKLSPKVTASTSSEPSACDYQSELELCIYLKYSNRHLPSFIVISD